MFRILSAKVLEPISMWVMIAGIASLCQPWVLWLHRVSVVVMLVGLVGFIVFSHVKPKKEEEAQGTFPSTRGGSQKSKAPEASNQGLER